MVRRLTLTLLVVLLAACGTVTATPVPTLPPRPPVPEHWRTIAAEDGTAEVSVPMETIVNTPVRRITGNLPAAAGAEGASFVAVGPGLIRPPGGGEPITEWLTDEGVWPDPTVYETTAFEQREVQLPAGPAIELSAQLVLKETGDEGWIVAYVVDASPGVGVLAFSALGSGPEPYAESIGLMRQLAVFRSG